MSSIKNHEYQLEDRTTLLETAAASIEHGLSTGRALPVNLQDFPQHLQVQRATFVTLQIETRLRGCMGVLAPSRPLIVDVAENAFAAAFRDPRFHKLTRTDAGRIDTHISVLSPPEPVYCLSESDLLRQVRPEIDGLILQYGHVQGTLLPSVWEDVSSAASFVRHLKLKAGLPEDLWAPQFRLFRYTTESFSWHDAQPPRQATSAPDV